MLDCDLDAVIDVDVGEAQTAVVSSVPNHYERVTVVSKQARTIVVGQDLEQEHSVHLAAPEESQELRFVQGSGDDVDRVAGVLDSQGRGHDHSKVGRVELLRHVHADETRPAGSDLAPRALGRKADLVHDAQDTLARLFGDIRFVPDQAAKRLQHVPASAIVCRNRQR